MEVEHRNQRKTLPLLIVGGTGPALLGRDWLNDIQLDWHNIHALHSDQWQSSLQDILARHKAVFQPGLGAMKGMWASIHVTPGSTPKFLKYRQVPYAIIESVEEELARLEREGVLERVDSSKWATALVCVRKRDGSVRLCGDYKLTINQCTEVDQYPLPRPEELIQKLAGGTRFTTLDLSQAYCTSKCAWRSSLKSTPPSTPTRVCIDIPESHLAFCAPQQNFRKLWSKSFKD